MGRGSPSVLNRSGISRLLLVVGCVLGTGRVHAQAAGAVDPQLIQQLIDQNKSLQQQLNAQQKTIDDLRARISAIDDSSAQQGQELQSMRTQLGDTAPAESKPPPSGDEFIRLSAVMGFAYFDSGPAGAYSNGEFRLDDAKVFLDASAWRNVFVHTEMDLETREAPDQNFHFGELYAEIESLSGAWGDDRALNLRVGRMYIPFGEEYEVRGIMENPLIAHSVTDIWGMDEGIEAYGELGNASYVLAVQDGALPELHNYHRDKSVAARVGYDPSSWLHLSASGMRTGHLNAASDGDSALWFGNTFFKPLGPLATTNGFWADLGELDAAVHWTGGEVKAAGGLVDFSDNNRAADDTRHLRYYYLEATQRLADSLSGAVRLSEVRAPGGFPIVGQGLSAEYASVSELTSSLSRLSMGLAYQVGPPVVLKVDFSPEWGETTSGDQRDQENLFSTELGVKF